MTEKHDWEGVLGSFGFTFIFFGLLILGFCLCPPVNIGAVLFLVWTWIMVSIPFAAEDYWNDRNETEITHNHTASSNKRTCLYLSLLAVTIIAAYILINI
jgi:hypothetical protein